MRDKGCASTGPPILSKGIELGQCCSVMLKASVSRWGSLTKADDVASWNHSQIRALAKG